MRNLRTISCTTILTLLAVGSLSLVVPAARAAFPVEGDRESGGAAFLSLANRTEEPNAQETIRSLIRRGIESRGVRCVPDSVLRGILRKYRIRTADLGVDADQAREIGENTGAKDLILGSIDIWRSDQDPEVGLSLRIVRVGDMRIVGASSVSARGRDYERAFGFGRISTVEDLAPRVVEKLLGELDHSPPPDPPGRSGEDSAGPGSERESPRVSLVPLDNLSAVTHGGEIVTSILLSTMVQAGFDVLEPGVVNGVFARCQQLPRGEIDYALIHALADATGPRLIVTGVVQDLVPAPGPEGVPRFEFGARGIDGRTGRVVFTVDGGGNGGDSGTILRLRRVRSLTGLVERSLTPVIEAVVRGWKDSRGGMEGRGAAGGDTGMAGTGWRDR